MTYATFSSTNKYSTITLSGGNLTAQQTNGSGYFGVVADSYNATGKRYCEFKGTASADITAVGICDSTIDASVLVGTYNYGGGSYDAPPAQGTHAYQWGGQYGKQYNGATAAYGGGAPLTNLNDVVSVLYDSDAGTISFWVNGVDKGVAFTGISAGSGWAPYFYDYGGCTVVANFGASAFDYSPPAGYVGWTTPSNDIAVTAPASTLVTGFDGVNKSAPAARLVTGFDGITKTAPAPTLSASITITGMSISAPAPTLSTTVLTGEVFAVDASAPAPTLESVLSPNVVFVVAATAPAPTLSSSSTMGVVATAALTAPAPTIEIGFKDARLTAPKPTLVVTGITGGIITVVARAATPILTAVNVNPTIITAAGSARTPRLVAILAGPAVSYDRTLTFAGSARVPQLSSALAAGQVITAVLAARAPRLVSAGLTGNSASVIVQAATPIMAAAGYPAYTITMGITTPAPVLSATMSAAVASAYRTWVLNTRKLALSEYSNFSFNSYAVFNSVVLGCGPSGIVTLGTQDLDGATAIAATVTSGKDNFGGSHIKRLPRAYIDYTTDGDAQFKLITTEGGSRTYSLNWNSVTGTQQRRIPVGKGPKSVRWQWEYTNVSGADFDFNAVLAYPTTTRRRVQ